MGKCHETGCSEKATHKFRAASGFKVSLCDRHYSEWEKYEDKRTPSTMLIGFGKGLVRFVAIIALAFGVFIIGFALYTFTQGTGFLFEMRLGLIFTELYIRLEDALGVSVAGMVAVLVGVAFFYIGFMKMEHDLW